MTTVQNITNTSIATSTAQTAATSGSKSSTSSTGKSTDVMGKQDFLTLLVAQLKNQDPLNPDNPTEFTAQLAQFSSLEQLTNLNTSMGDMVSATNNSTKISALGMIGKEVTFTGSSFTYNNAPVQLGYTLDGVASQVQLLIQNSNGQPVQTLNGTDLTKGNHTVAWNGLNQNGTAMPAGTYKVIIQAKGTDSAGVAASPFIKSEVTGVDLSGTGTALLNTKAGDIDFSKILGAYPSKGS
jgi:flagellar basal-body rod modification protein FlgD